VICCSAEGVESWRPEGTSSYVLNVADPRNIAPHVTRALVAAWVRCFAKSAVNTAAAPSSSGPWRCSHSSFSPNPWSPSFASAPSVVASVVDKAVDATFLVLSVAPAMLPAVIAGYSVVGEREQGTLEPLLTTPLRREELLLGKAVGVVVPAVGIAYVLFAVIQVCARLFASNLAVVSALGQGPHILAEILFAPLLAGWSI
jgi:hypothetical protein